MNGGSIEIYTLDGAGNDCLWVMPDVTLDNLIAHELGHVLGLANSSCSGHIMGPDWASDSPSSAECTGLDPFWTMPAEEPPPECDTCPRDSCETNPEACNNSPLVFQLDTAAYQMTGLDDPVRFDIDGDGILETVGWTARSSAQAFLALDRNRNGTVDDGRELFGDATRLADGSVAANGFEALAVFDSNHDGVIDSADEVWPWLITWSDANHNGISEPEELAPVAARGIEWMEYGYRTVNRHDANGNIFRYQSRFGLQGLRRNYYDVYLVSAPSSRGVP